MTTLSLEDILSDLNTLQSQSRSQDTHPSARHSILSLGNSLSASESSTDETSKDELKLLERYLASTKQISQLNQGSDDTGSNRIDTLYKQVADLQVKLDSVGSGIQEAIDVVGKQRFEHKS
ncbi:unnamed protein product [Sympodiomycopsis kandeliae]